MNSFIENVNYVANLDNKYGSSIKIYKNNLSLRTESHNLDFTLKYYNFDDKKIHNLEYSYSNILIENFNATLLNLKSQVDLTGLFDCDVSFNYTNFVINNIANISIFISSKTDNIKTCELNLKIRKDLNEIYNINGIVNDSMKILPYLASIDGEIFNDIITVSENIEDIQDAEENANTATTKANEASNSAISASVSAASALASKVSAENSATTATIKASEALSSSNVAINQAVIATTKATEALVSANNALASENKAEKWAIELEDIPVEPGKYSAMHWALKAQVFAEGNSANISYDNVDSGIVATNVQDAIDELDESIDWLTVNTYTKTEVMESLPNIGLDLSAGVVVTTGQIAWNADEGTADLGLSNGSTLQIGQENVRTVRNSTASTITNGILCMFDGTIGNSGRIKVKPFTAGFDEAMYLYGVATQNIISESDGIITIEGKVRGINTSGSPVGEVWNDEDILYAKPNDNGRMTNIVPADNELKLVVATVIKAHATNGTLEIRFTPMNENLYYTKVQNDILLSNKVPLNSDFILDLGEI